MTISTSVRGIDELKAFFASLPAALRRLVVPTVSEYLIGDDSHGLRHMVAYKYVSRAAAYSDISFTTSTGKVIKGYGSLAQFQHVMIGISKGEIGTPGRSNRTGAMSAGWSYTLQGGGYGAKITNSAPGVQYVYGDDTQANQLRMVGHRTMMTVISTNINGAIQRAEQAIQRWIDSHD